MVCRVDFIASRGRSGERQLARDGLSRTQRHRGVVASFNPIPPPTYCIATCHIAYTPVEISVTADRHERKADVTVFQQGEICPQVNPSWKPD